MMRATSAVVPQTAQLGSHSQSCAELGKADSWGMYGEPDGSDEKAMTIRIRLDYERIFGDI